MGSDRRRNSDGEHWDVGLSPRPRHGSPANMRASPGGWRGEGLPPCLGGPRLLAVYLGAIEDVMIVLSHGRGHEGGSVAPTP